MFRKTLHDAVSRPKRTSSGKIPHVFHRHGELKSDNKSLRLPNEVTVPIETETQKITAYGIVAAGDSMVPYKSSANISLSHSLRVAVGTDLMNEIGAHHTAPALPIRKPPDTVYHHAINAIVHWGTANEKDVLKTSVKFIKHYGLTYQASLLGPLVKAAIEMAREHRADDLEWFYKEFHSLFGNENKPNPDAPKKEKKEDKPFELPEYIPPDVTTPHLDLDGSGEKVGWGMLDAILKVPMSPWKHPHIRSQRAWRYSEFGVFKYPWRSMISSDMRCFSLQRRQYGGTVLIDFSGSMSIKQSEVDAILMAAPYATIAAYGSHPRDSYLGNIVIMAENSKKGFASSARELIGKGNVIDGPALRWLAGQAGPRIWISDGVVTGVGDMPSREMEIDASNICRAGKIVRIPTLAELISLIKN